MRSSAAIFASYSRRRSAAPGIIVECPGLKLLDPDPDQVARDVVASGERVKRFARNEFLGDLSFEFDAMGTVPGHGFHPLTFPRESIPMR
jgi:hypothetical protein